MRDFIAQLLQPHTLLLLGLMGTMTLILRRKASRSRAVILAGIFLGLLYFLSTPLAGFLAMRTLEGSYLSANVVPGPSDTIVVLSGSMQRDDELGEQVRVGPETFYRCYHAVHLYQKAGRCRLVLTGGKVDTSEPGPALAKVMQDFVTELGVQADDVVCEDQSSTTYQNALFSKDLLDHPSGGRIFLVTDAVHMPRAIFSFEAQGVTVIPAPCNFHARRFELTCADFLPSTKAAADVSYAAHEWVGLAWYRLRSP